MKLAMNMIREYAEIPVTPKEYESRMIMSGTAVEGVEDISGGMEKVRELIEMEYGVPGKVPGAGYHAIYGGDFG